MTIEIDRKLVARLSNNPDFIEFMQFVCHRVCGYKQPNISGNSLGEVSTTNILHNSGREYVYGELRKLFPRKALIDIEFLPETENDRLGETSNHERPIRTRRQR